MADGRCEAMHVRRKTAGLMLAAAAAAGLTMAAALPASASATGYYKLLVRVGTFAPAMCLQPADPGGGAGTAIVQQPCTSSQAQNWAPVGIGSSYKFVNQATGLCMDAHGGAAHGPPVAQWACHNIRKERWARPHRLPDSFWPIRAHVPGTRGFA